MLQQVQIPVQKSVEQQIGEAQAQFAYVMRYIFGEAYAGMCLDESGIHSDEFRQVVDWADDWFNEVLNGVEFIEATQTFRDQLSRLVDN